MSDKKAWIGLAVLALPSLLVSIDVFVMLLALPRLSADLGASSTEQLWIMDVYGFLLSGFMITMGTLGDRIGRRKLLLIGSAAFAAASVMAAFSVSPLMLIAARAVLGIAGATLAPSTLALISNMFPNPKQRGLAIGIWLMCFMGGATLGPLVGGALLQHLWWGAVFLLGVPVMAVLLAVGPVLLPEYRNPDAGKLDLVSVALSLAAILPFVYGVKQLAYAGWQPVPVAAVLVGVVVGAVFVRRQTRLEHPLLDLRLFTRRSFSTALVSMLVGTMLMGAMMLFQTQHLELVQGLSPLQSAFWMIPMAVASLITFQVSPLLARRFRPAYLIAGGLAVSITGLLVITQVGATSGPVLLVTGWSLINLGSGPLVTLGTDLVIGSAPVEKAGSAAAIGETSNEFGFALGIAALGSVGTAVYRALLPSGVPAAARDTLASATEVAGTLSGQASDALLSSAREAFTSGMHVAALISAVALAVVAVATAILLRHVRPTAEPAPADTTDPVLVTT
ncbi:MFS transporter [Fodinicola acaciae]|uniref:MFS transporter n=1 Tax=Fodinicola acaciae TaxID=2681555 RepID=UPI0013CF66B1|nr:MFS transporter [Fodinicola acaciae]